MFKILILSNGHGEDLSGSLIAKQFVKSGYSVHALPIVGMGKDESATNCLVMALRPPYHMSFMERFFYPLERDKIGNAKKIPISSVAPPYRCHTTVLCLLYDCFSFLFYGYPSIAKIK